MLKYMLLFFLRPALLSAEPIGLGRLSEIMRIFKKFRPRPPKCGAYLTPFPPKREVKFVSLFEAKSQKVFKLAILNFVFRFLVRLSNPRISSVSLIGPPLPPQK